MRYDTILHYTELGCTILYPQYPTPASDTVYKKTLRKTSWACTMAEFTALAETVRELRTLNPKP